MAGLEPPAREKPSAISDTRYASQAASLQSLPQHPPLHAAAKQNLSEHRPSPPLAAVLPPTSTRSSRSQSLATQSSIYSVASSNQQPIKRKPLPSVAAAPLALSDLARNHLEILDVVPSQEQHTFTRSFAVDSPTLYEFPGRQPVVSLDTKAPATTQGVAATTGSTSSPSPVHSRAFRDADAGVAESRNIPVAGPAAPQTRQTAAQSQHEDLTARGDRIHAADEQPADNHNTNSNSTSLFVRKPSPPHLVLSPVDSSIRASARAPSPVDVHKPLPKSPSSSKLGTFFGWSTSSPSSTNFSDKASDKGFSPLPSPLSPKPTTVFTDDSPVSAPGSFSAKTIAAGGTTPLGYCEDYLQTPPATSTSSPSIQIEEMEDELKAISAELAASIRREMDLEDLVDRMQAEINNPQAPGKRTSDYFSDSGYSSAKFSEYDHNKEEIAQVHRRAEQEKAQIRLELTDKLTSERSRRKVLDQQIKELAQRASTLNLAQTRSQDTSVRVKDLENTCEDLRRRLSEERQVKDNFEDLLSALKSELQTAANERDNLRDEIVPQLRARVEGLEAQAADHAVLTYETTKIQQELQSLKTENTNLRSSQQPPPSANRSKSNSVAARQPFKLQQAPLSRSNTVKTTESRDALAERLKDVEAQRDALHSALKNLLERQEFQNRENDKKIKVLEVERDRLLSDSPKKASYEKEVSNLRQEITVLRRRAEEAMEQKWQVEKGLGGLKMDLDRAEEEIAGLRSLLREKDILIPAAFARSSSSSSGSSHGLLGVPVTSASLEKAYKDLQRAYAESLERIKSLELGGSGATHDERTKLAMQRLERSLSSSVSERDVAKSDASAYRAQLDSLQASEKKHLASEHDLAAQLSESARRVEELAQQVQSQLTANSTLRTRLNDTVARGEAEQKSNTDRIAGLQARLKTLEDQLVATQTAAEERLAKHEDEVTALKDGHAAQLQRLRDSPRALQPAAGSKSPLLSPALLSPRPSPRRSTTMPAGGEEQLAEVATLKKRVAELESALTTADAEMQEVVGRMNTAQIEVMQLQEEREGAARETRRLQRLVETEKVKAFEERFKKIGSP